VGETVRKAMLRLVTEHSIAKRERACWEGVGSHCFLFNALFSNTHRLLGVTLLLPTDFGFELLRDPHTERPPLLIGLGLGEFIEDVDIPDIPKVELPKVEFPKVELLRTDLRVKVGDVLVGIGVALREVGVLE